MRICKEQRGNALRAGFYRHDFQAGYAKETLRLRIRISME